LHNQRIDWSTCSQSSMTTSVDAIGDEISEVYKTPAAIAKAGSVFNVSVCVCKKWFWAGDISCSVDHRISGCEHSTTSDSFTITRLLQKSTDQWLKSDWKGSHSHIKPIVGRGLYQEQLEELTALSHVPLCSRLWGREGNGSKWERRKINLDKLLLNLNFGIRH